jgi:hypothetical protein
MESSQPPRLFWVNCAAVPPRWSGGGCVAQRRKQATALAPVLRGVAALPHVDAFMEGHSLAAYEHLAAVVLGRADGGRTRA